MTSSDRKGSETVAEKSQKLLLFLDSDSPWHEQLTRVLTSSDRELDVVVPVPLVHQEQPACRGLSSVSLGRRRAAVSFLIQVCLRPLCGVRREILLTATRSFIVPGLLLILRPLHGKRMVVIVTDPQALAALAPESGTQQSPFSRLRKKAMRSLLCRADALVFSDQKFGQVLSLYRGASAISSVVETGFGVDAPSPKGPSVDAILDEWTAIFNELSEPETVYPAKRWLDIGLSAGLLALLAPWIGATALGVLIFMGRPVFFRQDRRGKGGKPFTIIKFRSMVPPLLDEEEGTDNDGVRLTLFGKLIRRLSLDELPSLLNVLKGEMSLVGPRPLFMKYWHLYSTEQMRRHDVPPGVTGWAQVNGRNSIDWPEKFKKDLFYVDNQSITLDLRILAMTFVRVLTMTGVSGKGHATMAEFKVASNGTCDEAN